MGRLLKLKPVFKERIWGGTALRDSFGYEIPSDQTGECWAISAHPNGGSIVENGPFAGKELSWLWNHHRELFDQYEGDRFPLLTKILDAKKDLSVQVHPDDDYAKEHENGELGKTECWYIIDCKQDAELVIGHHARSRAKLVQMIHSGGWEELLRRVKIKPGDFFYVPSGTIHALCEETLVLETQQSSDTTYRVYDYDRIDQNGEKRELHLKKAIDVVTVPDTTQKSNVHTYDHGSAQATTYIEDKYFSVYKWDISDDYHVKRHAPFLLCSVINGKGEVKADQETLAIKKGDHFIITARATDLMVSGNLELIVSHP
ncbi:mannose-6-phosphate isomerase [Bacillus sp. SA1-12]|uniref:mannose-6-phosphate isomerase, class I n=1 Tax=Bacillus sp. SA1-12 TaxID=1455638 RepID=UPI000626F90B|nr:mannose-6-phosphate isomerase, class I [Bacillus sp. SA1-12]KKI89191.1 mannose-6-phosphate isomerase [Bacillus sp. SA1-12]